MAESDELSLVIGAGYDRIIISVRSGAYAVFKNWVIVTKPQEETKQYVDEDGNVVEQTVFTGGKVLLAGSLSNGFSEVTGGRSRTLHFYFKRR